MYSTQAGTEVIHQDRRDDRRYSIDLELRYEVIARGRKQLCGSGRALDLSSGGVRFSSDRSLPVGASVKLFVRWPVMLKRNCPLTLLIVGRVIRSDGQITAAKTSHER